ncbi:MerR family transcriptional regulator [Faecalicatena contorta]|uniref:helix-turn-helix domain-containing protein n=1 Tax=Faecalicatena contorta TaxID=39482 RepID=UPI001F3CB634|nr:MerR family transcriptional regulator [Faecalicatena contorta]MCF2684373.1 MerR family transcriptional regulator [Faecalicatena contorta]
MLIKEVEQVTGIKSVNIRYYEKENLIHPIRKMNGYREYSDEDVRRLKQIKTLRLLNVSVPDIQEVLDGKTSLRSVMEKRLNELQEEEQKIKEIKATCEIIIMDDISVADIDEGILYGDKNTWKVRLEQIMKEDIDKKFLGKSILYLILWILLGKMFVVGFSHLSPPEADIAVVTSYVVKGIGIFFILYGIGLTIFEGITEKDFLWVYGRDWGANGLGALGNSFAICGLGIAFLGSSIIQILIEFVIVCAICIGIRGFIMYRKKALKRSARIPMKNSVIMLIATGVLLVMFILSIKFLQYDYSIHL